MTRYKLKDRELQKQLDRLSRGDFSRRLDEWNGDRSQELVNFSFGEETGHDSFPRTFETAIRTADIEEAPEYDPTRWNLWPNVEPPEDVGMQIEIVQLDPSGKPLKLPRFCGYSTFRNNYWYNIGHVDNDEIVRFRPWDRPEENKE